MFDLRECFIFFYLLQKLNSPLYVKGAGPGLFSLGAFPTFRSTIFCHGCLYVESNEGGREGLKRFVTVVAWKFLKISSLSSVLEIHRDGRSSSTNRKKKFTVVCQSSLKTLNFIISPCSWAKGASEMHQNVSRTCTAFVLLIGPLVLMAFSLALPSPSWMHNLPNHEKLSPRDAFR